MRTEELPSGESLVTVTISVQGTPLFMRSAIRIKERNGDNTYLVDTGKQIRVKGGEGTVVLAHKMLNTIQEPREKKEVADTRTYYKTREEAEQMKRPGDRIYSSEEKGFWVTTPRKKGGSS